MPVVTCVIQDNGRRFEATAATTAADLKRWLGTRVAVDKDGDLYRHILFWEWMQGPNRKACLDDTGVPLTWGRTDMKPMDVRYYSPFTLLDGADGSAPAQPETFDFGAALAHMEAGLTVIDSDGNEWSLYTGAYVGRLAIQHGHGAWTLSGIPRVCMLSPWRLQDESPVAVARRDLVAAGAPEDLVATFESAVRESIPCASSTQ